MKYYSIDASYDVKVIGFYPSTSVYKENREYYNRGIYDQPRLRYDQFPDFEPRIGLKLAYKAKVTNLLDPAILPFGYVIDESFLNILKAHNLPPYRCYQVDVYHRDKVLNYYWFHYIFDMWKYVDVNLSKAYICRNDGDYKILDEFSFQSEDHFRKIKKGLNFEKRCLLKEIYLRKECSRFDIIEDTAFFRTLISERLRNALLDAGMTGFETDEYTKIHFI